jgi:hypothetical protein
MKSSSEGATMPAGGTAVSEHMTNHAKSIAPDRDSTVDDEIAQIRESLRGLRFGSVNIIVQDGVIIQIDRTEKRRLRNNRNT